MLNMLIWYCDGVMVILHSRGAGALARPVAIRVMVVLYPDESHVLFLGNLAVRPSVGLLFERSSERMVGVAVVPVVCRLAPASWRSNQPAAS